MADQEHNSILTNQAEGKTGATTPIKAEDKATQDPTANPAQAQGGFTGDVSGQADAPRAQGESAQGAPMPGQQDPQTGLGQPGAAQQSSGDPIGQNMQSYGQSVDQDAASGQGAQEAQLASAGSSGVLGKGPGQTTDQPASPTTGGPDLSKGLVDSNKGGGI